VLILADKKSGIWKNKIGSYECKEGEEKKREKSSSYELGIG
jgi:hypothetical protein